MAKLNYNGNVVNAAVSQLNNISYNWDSLISEMKVATNKIVSSKGFDKYIGGITSDSFSSLVSECQISNKNLVQLIKQMQIDILAYSQDEDAIQAFLDELDGNDYKNLNLSPIEDHISLGRKASNIFKGFTSSLATAGLGLLEGIGNFGETGADLITLGKSAVCSIFTGTYDLLTGSNTTQQMWEDTKAKVSEKRVETAFNNFYSNNPIGQKIKNNAYGFDTVRGISNGIGYSAGLIGLNVVTGGLASGLGVGAAGSVGAGQLAASAGLMGFSSGTEDAWADGATIEKGLMYGAATGAWESAQWAIGAKINQYGGVGDRIASGIFKGGKSGAITRITLDAADSGLEGIVQPGLKMIYKNYEGNTFSEKYKNAFQEAGGWNNVGMQAFMGGIMSAGSELMDARKILKSNKKKDSYLLDESIFDDDISSPNKEIVEDFSSRELSGEGKSTAAYRAKSGEWIKNASDLFMSYKDAYPNLSDAEISSRITDVISGRVDLSNTELNIISSHIYKYSGGLDQARHIFESNFSSAACSQGFANSVNRTVPSSYDNLTQEQQIFVSRVNNRIRENGGCKFTLRNTQDITIDMLNSIDDLSKVEITILGGFADSNGRIRPEYDTAKYIDRVTYTGREVMDIEIRLGELEGKIDMNLPYNQRAKQIYEMLAGEYSYLHEAASDNATREQYIVGASLRGLTSNNALGKEGLVCAGYAQAYKELCDRADINCVYISSNIPGGRHAWNEVICQNGEIIPVDCTWRSGSSKSWFGKSHTFAVTHGNPNYDINAKDTYITLRRVVDTMDTRYGTKGIGLRALYNYLSSGNARYITSAGNSREIIVGIDDRVIREFLNSYT